MGGTVLNTTINEKNLGLTITRYCWYEGISSVEFQHRREKILGLIMQNIVNKEKRSINTAIQNNSYATFRTLYTSMAAISQEGYWYAQKSTKESNQNYPKLGDIS